MVFIRAPYITEIAENAFSDSASAPDYADDTVAPNKDSTVPMEGVKILSEIDGHIVAAQYRNQIGLAFHPEMTDDTRIHQYFIDLVKSYL